MRKIRVGTRGSRLAIWQTDFVINKLLELDDRLEIEKVIIKTTGDKFLDVALSRIGDKGLFIKEIEKELLDGSIDMAVHSMKDMPTRITEGLAIGAVLPRENSKDVLLSRDNRKLAELPVGAAVGTSSLRRKAQLLALRPDLNIVDLRGNIDTRIRRLQNGELDAIVLAAAGVIRLGYEELVAEELEIIPAVGQGAIAVEIRDDDTDIRELVEKLDDRSTRLAIAGERAFLAALEGGCQIPIGCGGSVRDDFLTLEGLVSDLEGKQVFRSRLSGPAAEAEDLGRKLALELVSRGAGAVLEQIRIQEMGDE
ncbi:MAG: hydroxymethylbilane synthase [Syntrophomonadaceae bacterium]|nr:hydroxymethylbilane synthase [Syntrophomonadaceae bacterium]